MATPIRRAGQPVPSSPARRRYAPVRVKPPTPWPGFEAWAATIGPTIEAAVGFGLERRHLLDVLGRVGNIYDADSVAAELAARIGQ